LPAHQPIEVVRRPFKKPPLAAESGGATRAMLLAMSAHRGTGSSNPLPSSRESIANLDQRAEEERSQPAVSQSCGNQARAIAVRSREAAVRRGEIRRDPTRTRSQIRTRCLARACAHRIGGNNIILRHAGRHQRPPPLGVLRQVQIRTASGYTLLAPGSSSASPKAFVAEDGQSRIFWGGSKR
jgi:hypothetical protein